MSSARDATAALVGRLADALLARNATMAAAESCTGGLVAAACTARAGSSAWFERGVVTYSNAAKVELLGVADAVIAAHGAVSAEVARAMADGVIARTPATFAVAVTGIAGPGGGTAEKPVGTVWIGVSTARTTRAEKRFNPVDRETFKYVVSQQALDLLRRELTNEERPALDIPPANAANLPPA